MATPEDVNAQHLASMGVNQDDLGQPYLPNPNTAVSQEGRCSSRTADAFQCARSEGHDGRHARGSMTWDVEENDRWALQDQAKHCDDQVAHVSHRHGDEDWYCSGMGTNPTKQRDGDQVLPKPGQQCVQDLVIAEMQESKRVGLERYGSTLQTFNSRRSIQDCAEEVRDLHVYLTQIKAESETDRETLVKVVLEAFRASNDHAPFEGLTGIGAKRVAEMAVDAIMGWVVGQRMGHSFATQEELYCFIDMEVSLPYEKIESLTHALGDRLGIPSEES